MKKSISNSISFKSIALILAIFASRLGYFPANFSPLGTFGFFGSGLLFFISIFAFDYLIGGFYQGFLGVYLGFACYPLLGFLAHKYSNQNTNSHNKKTFFIKFSLLLSASLLFFLISNASVWWHWYPRTLEGLITCYTLALPFFQKTLISDTLFTLLYLLYPFYLPYFSSLRNYCKINKLQLPYLHY